MTSRSDQAELRDAPRRAARRAGGGRGPPPRRRARRPRHLLAQGVRPAHDAVPRPLRLLHVRQAAGPARVAVPHARRGARDRAARRRARVPRGAVHAGRGARGALPAGRGVARRARLRDRRSTTSSRCASWSSTRPACSPTPTRARSPKPSSTALRAVSPSQGMMIETLAARLGEPGGPHYGAPDKTPERRLATLEAAGPRRGCRSPPASSSASARRAPSASTRSTRSRASHERTVTCKK